MNDNNTIYIVTDDGQRYEQTYHDYVRNATTITWEDMAGISRASRAERIYGIYDSIYDNLRNHNSTTRLSDYDYGTDYATVSNKDFGSIYYPNEEEQILSFYYVNCDDA